MYIPAVFNARRIVYLGGQAFWVRALTAGGWAEILAWLDDVMPDGRDERDGPPPLGSDEAQAWLATPDGRTLLCWIALRDPANDVSYEAARELWMNASEGEQARLLSVLKARRRTAMPAPEAGSDEPVDHPDRPGSDLAETWCGEGFAQLAAAVGLDRLADLSLDQIEWLQSGGKCDEHADPAIRARAAAQRAWLEMEERRKAEREASGEGDADPDADADARAAATVTITAEQADRQRIAMLMALQEQAARRDAGQPFRVPTAEDVARFAGGESAADDVGRRDDEETV